jgi:serine/threonine protein kinase
MFLGNRYQLQEPIGRGLMAIIYRGIDAHTNQVVAVKILKEVYTQDPKFVRRFQKETEIMASLQHPNIVQVYDYGQTDGNYFIVMELVDGTDLRHYLGSRGILDIKNAMKIAHDVALGLGDAHRHGIVHGAAIPQHILLCRNGSIKLTGFSIASVCSMDGEELSTTGVKAIPYYPPEQAQGEIITPAADVYSLGMVMYEMVTGHPPFDGNSPVEIAMKQINDIPKPPSQFNPNIPIMLEEIIMRCLEKSPNIRYRDGSQLARALELMTKA